MIINIMKPCETPTVNRLIRDTQLVEKCALSSCFAKTGMWQLAVLELDY
jgi:hypothetical protein